MLIEETENYMREQKVNPKLFDPDSFRTIAKGRHMLVLACPKGKWSDIEKKCVVSMKLQSIQHPKNVWKRQCRHRKCIVRKSLYGTGKK